MISGSPRRGVPRFCKTLAASAGVALDAAGCVKGHSFGTEGGASANGQRLFTLASALP